MAKHSPVPLTELPRRIGSLLLVLLLSLSAGCAAAVSSATARFAENLSSAIADQNDPETVKEGAPAYLLLVDGLIRDEPQSVRLLLSGAKLYATYAATFVDEPARAKRLTIRARDYANRALCRQMAAACPALARPYGEFVQALAAATTADLPALYTWALAWAGWIQAHSDDWNAVAELPKVEAALRGVIERDDGFADGAAHLYLGVITSLRPPALGGKPEEARRHFERAVELSGGRNLMASVLFAKHYARLVFDRELHDRLLRAVLGADPVQPGQTLSNTLAQREARRLLATSADYF